MADQQTARPSIVDAIVVGAGFSGLYMVHRLRELGLSIRAYECGADVGGTWYWNRYPGASSDSESYYYSYSFSDEIRQEWQWSRRYPGQPEILRYLNFVADKLDLRRDFTFNTRVTAGTFNERTQRWDVETQHGDRISAQFFISAVGCLSAAQMPDIEGRDSFAGRLYHTGNWPHEEVDFTGQRVAVIGTGSSGIQSIPIIAAQADHLTVFQRTPNYSVPARNGAVSAEFRAEVQANHAAIRSKTLQSPIGMPFDIPQQSALEVSAEERKRTYDALWDVGGFRFMFSSYNDLILDKEANETAAEYVRDRIRGMVRDPATAEKLVPKDYPIGTKRPPMDTSYYETFNRDNVTLVNIKANPIEEITPGGIRTSDGATYDLDSIVFATGFDAVTGSLIRLNLRGKAGLTLADKWEHGPRTYLGVAIAGFPNLFMITGPGSPSVLANMPVCIEQHVDWIADCITAMAQRGKTLIEPTEAAEDEWVVRVNTEAAATLLPQANSWYMGANIPGKPRVFLAYPSGINVYTEICAGIAERDYEGFIFQQRRQLVAAV